MLPFNPQKPRTRNPRYIPPRGDDCPIRKLPPEVLVYIFELGTHREEDEDDWGIKDDWEIEEDDGDEEYEMLTRRRTWTWRC
ncbi:hypothetical protein ACEPAI_9161 [Sanghuangporus weigelae]